MVCEFCKSHIENSDENSLKPICAFDDNGNFVLNNWNCMLINKLREIGEQLNCNCYNKYTEDTIITIPYNDGFVILSHYKSRGSISTLYEFDGMFFKECNLEVCLEVWHTWNYLFN